MLKLTSIAMTGLLALVAVAPAQAANLADNDAVVGSTIAADIGIEIPVSADALQGKAENRRHFRSRSFGHHRGLHHRKSHLKHKKVFRNHKGFSRHHDGGFRHHKKFSKFGHSKYSGHRSFRRR
ncbi:hypothetical protein [Parasphingorhabdus cellanae]|uniref:Uncharacterized protein n=1 Tax=Parasphingorhabdus cellanae TaxID=2806553 RepID=A0ABX7T8X6_9SPHN|nr:hypothetical protein [Parasphingorhabdus cellanae]QTD57611.1 hypothetical protein J4G78_08900 [Parasphingorhabdus cellanae]